MTTNCSKLLLLQNLKKKQNESLLYLDRYHDNFKYTLQINKLCLTYILNSHFFFNLEENQINTPHPPPTDTQQTRNRWCIYTKSPLRSSQFIGEENLLLGNNWNKITFIWVLHRAWCLRNCWKSNHVAFQFVLSHPESPTPDISWLMAAEIGVKHQTVTVFSHYDQHVHKASHFPWNRWLVATMLYSWLVSAKWSCYKNVWIWCGYGNQTKL